MRSEGRKKEWSEVIKDGVGEEKSVLKKMG